VRPRLGDMAMCPHSEKGELHIAISAYVHGAYSNVHACMCICMPGYCVCMCMCTHACMLHVHVQACVLNGLSTCVESKRTT
jgi:hypothetical protein